MSEFLVFSSVRADFGFKIDFIRDTEDPARVFRTFSGLIDFCKTTDKTLVKSLDIDIEPELLLDSIEQGYLIVWLKNIFTSTNNELLNFNPKLISYYLVEAKSHIIKFLNSRNTINSYSEILELQAKLMSLAKDTNTNDLGIYIPPNDKDLLLSIDKFQLATSELQAADKLYYLTSSLNLPLNYNFSISPESKDNLLTKETIKAEAEMILKVKKPDYLGESKWEFKHKKRKIDAKINDLEWLKQFRQGDIILSPGYAVKARVEIVEKYDFQGNVISIQHTIQKIIEVLPMPAETQLSLFQDRNLETNS
ncbi:MAG TPA: hypothetical protein V6D11_16845 [Waterburya sp.]|jgi:hypothetical protein